MLKKDDIITILANGGHISLNEIYRSATVYARNGERLDSCRYDTAERIGQMDGYTDKRGEAWSFTRWITDDSAADIREYTETETNNEEENTMNENTINAAQIAAERAAAERRENNRARSAAAIWSKAARCCIFTRMRSSRMAS